MKRGEKFKPGDIAAIGHRCRNAGKLVLILGKHFAESRNYQVQYCDTGLVIEADESNMDLVSKSTGRA